MSTLPPTAFETLMTQLSATPLWIKQVIYANLRFDMERAMSKSTLDTFGYDDLLQLMVPEITRVGIRELDQPGGQLSQGMLKLLHLARHRKTVIDITIINNWTLEQCAVYLLDAIQRELVIEPKSGIIKATIDYLAGKTRLGEYLVKINRLTVEQLDQALRTQKYIEESMGERTGIANVLINLGYINREDSEGILFLKEESKKNFQIPNLAGDGQGGQELVKKYQAQLQQAMNRIKQLEMENHQLQQQRR